MSDALILVADDNEADRVSLASVLMEAGYPVMQAVDGGTARRVMNEYPVAVAFIDHFMDPYGGVDFARFMTIDKISVPMFLVTQDDDSGLLMEATKLGFTGLLKKPVSPERVLAFAARYFSKPQ